MNEYAERAMSTCLDTSENDIYAITGLTAEVGEINDKIAKWVRKGWINFENNNWKTNLENVPVAFDPAKEFDPIHELALELGDVLWFVALMAEQIGYPLGVIAEMNLKKLASRKERGVIDGAGDHR